MVTIIYVYTGVYVQSGFPLIRLVSLQENGTRVLFGSQMTVCRTGEATLADLAVGPIREAVLCLAGVVVRVNQPKYSLGGAAGA